MVVTNNIENLMLSDFSIQEFIRETKKDLSSPTTSTFTSKVGKLKQMTNLIEEVRCSLGLGLGFTFLFFFSIRKEPGRRSKWTLEDEESCQSNLQWWMW